ncbi:MAG: hypothetical protein RIQ99_302, partial [Pseudomonadota bacterium]
MSKAIQNTPDSPPPPGALIGLGILVIVLIAIVAWAVVGGRL